MLLSMRLGAEQGRVVGSLIEKQLTTPQQYPLSLNALVLACNQVSNRDPVVSYDERLVDDTLVLLKDAGLVRFVHPSHGRSVTRYRQVLDERLGLDNQELALVGVLLLRGAQTAGELRSRTERMAEFDGVGAIERDLERLNARPEPLVARVSRRPGQKEDRWTQLLMAEVTGSDPAGAVAPAQVSAAEAAPALAATPASAPAATPPAAPPASPSPDSGSLADEVAALRAEVADLRAALEHLQDQLGGA
jgi:uncharacterized protein YceH (UPF0502 family)